MPSNHTTIGAWVNSKLSGICCVLHVNESGLVIPISNILSVCGCQSSTWSIGQDKIRGASTKKLQGEHEIKKKTKNK